MAYQLKTELTTSLKCLDDQGSNWDLQWGDGKRKSFHVLCRHDRDESLRVDDILPR